MANESKVLDEVSRAALALLLKEPFYAHILAGMPREVSDTIKTTGTAWDGQQVRLRVNPEFFIDGLTAAQRTGVLKHEILHVAFRHVFRGSNRDAKVFSVAADLVVNQLVKPHPLPDGYPALADFPDLGLEPDESVDDYYGGLMKLLREMRQAGFGGTSHPEAKPATKMPKETVREPRPAKAARARRGARPQAMVPSGPAARARPRAPRPSRSSSATKPAVATTAAGTTATTASRQPAATPWAI
jgi:hypothetical protein